jgi:phosphoribosylformylglycinamidine synthase subunit PurQ / glutaminase
MSRPSAIVLFGDGINCDTETAWALEQAGFTASRLHTSEFLEQPDKLFAAQLLALPGGFSFGDEIASGKILAVKLKQKLKDVLYRYIERGKLVIGICNGFQVLTQLGLLPYSEPTGPRLVSLTHNQGGKFINRWVELDVSPHPKSPFFKSLDRIQLPIRHGEGRLRLKSDLKAELVEAVTSNAVLRYTQDINGSHDKIAALTNPQGNVLGLMPHPEAFIRWTQHPAWNTRAGQDGTAAIELKSKQADGLTILQNAAQAV